MSTTWCRSGYKLIAPSAVETIAVNLLAGVGKTDGEWWLFSGARVRGA